MSADKRSVSTDALATLGTIIDKNQKRDAIHLAVIPVRAKYELEAGQHVGLDKDGEASLYIKDKIGIVDPFITTTIGRGQWFWLVIYPRVITSLRHVWTHPALPDEPINEPAKAILSKAEESEQWLRDFCKHADCPSYETVIGYIKDNRHSWDDEYMHFDGQNAHGDIPDEFWDHVENVVGFRPNIRPSYFSCSC